MKDNVGFVKRALAYFLDMLIVGFISGTLYFGVDAIFKFDTSITETYNEKTTELAEKLTETQITEDEYIEEFMDLSTKYYQGMAEESVPYGLIEFIVMIAYMVGLAYYSNGQTIGKKTFNIKVVDKKGKTPSLNTFFVRSLINYSLYVSMVELILVFILNKGFFELSIIVEGISIVITLLSVIMIVFNDDKRGIHDHISGTKVVNDYDE